LFETLEPKPADAILKLIGEHQNDPRPDKIDLGVGVYRDALGNTPVLKTVKKAEHWLVGSQQSKSYLGSRGDAQFCAAMQSLTFGAGFGDSDRIATLQTPVGSGALRVGAGVILRASPDATLWVSDPTWNNHTPLLGGAGIRLSGYPYYDTERHNIRFDEMMTTLRGARKGDLVLLHGCCHNPTGLDLSPEQWDRVTDLVTDAGLIPFVDLAYQGFAKDVEADAEPIRKLIAHVPELLVVTSCSKNFGLYRDRVGTLSFVATDAATAAVVSSQALNVVRTMYSVPPDHGAAVVARILTDDHLRAEWLEELGAMRARLKNVRSLLVRALTKAAPNHDFSHITRANGMFSYLGVSAEQVERLKKDYGIYLVESSRINVCGITEDNVSYLAKSVAAVL
jgi:aspartate/tyrosine/aromatic aminotransferase